MPPDLPRSIQAILSIDFRLMDDCLPCTLETKWSATQLCNRKRNCGIIYLSNLDVDLRYERSTLPDFWRLALTSLTCQRNSLVSSAQVIRSHLCLPVSVCSKEPQIVSLYSLANRSDNAKGGFDPGQLRIPDRIGNWSCHMIGCLGAQGFLYIWAFFVCSFHVSVVWKKKMSFGSLRSHSLRLRLKGKIGKDRSRDLEAVYFEFG